MTQEMLDAVVNNSEFTECIDEAAPYRVKIINDIAPQMKEVQDAYLKLMVEADYLGVSEITAKLKLDKKDEEAKDRYAKWKKRTMGLFRATLKTIHPNEGQVPSVGMLYVAGSLLEYIGKGDLVSGNENVDANNPLKFKKLEDLYPFFKDPDAKVRIKKDVYEKLPVTVRYDKDLNKRGLKANHFCALVKHKAMGMIKDKDSYTKYISNQVDNTNNNIDREEVILGKTKQM